MAFTTSKAAGKLSIVAARLAWGAPWLGLGRPQGVPLHPSDTESLTSPRRARRLTATVLSNMLKDQSMLSWLGPAAQSKIRAGTYELQGGLFSRGGGCGCVRGYPRNRLVGDRCDSFAGRRRAGVRRSSNGQ